MRRNYLALTVVVVCLGIVGGSWAGGVYNPPVVTGGGGGGGGGGATVAVPWASVLTVDAGTYDRATVALTGDAVLDTPTGASEGSRVRWFFTAVESNSTVTLTNAYVIPSTTVMSNTITVVSNTTSIVLTEKLGSYWLITGYVRGYSTPSE